MTNYIQCRLSLDATRRSQLLKKFHAFYGIFVFINTFIKACPQSMAWTRQIQTMYQTWTLDIHFSNTFPPTVGRPSCLSKFSFKTCILLSCMHATCPPHFMLHNLFGLRIMVKSKIMPLLIKPCSKASQNFRPARSNIPLCTLNLSSSLNSTEWTPANREDGIFIAYSFEVYAHL